MIVEQPDFTIPDRVSDGATRYRLAEVIALHASAASLSHLMKVLRRLDTFGNGTHTEHASKRDDRTNDGMAIVTARKVANKRLIYLDFIKWE